MKHLDVGRAYWVSRIYLIHMLVPMVKLLELYNEAISYESWGL